MGMEHGEDGVLKWTYTKHLYRDWGGIKACLIAFTIAPAAAFAFFTVVCGFMDGFSLRLLALQGKIWGAVLLGSWLMTFLALFIWAWANGGVDEWEYEMDGRGIKGRKIVRKAWRMKLLRGFAWILMLAPAKPGQKLALRGLLYDNEKKEKKVDLVMLRGVECDEKKGRIAMDTFNGSAEIFVPGEDYAEVLALIERRLPKKGAKRKRPGGRKRSSASDQKEKEGMA